MYCFFYFCFYSIFIFNERIMEFFFETLLRFWYTIIVVFIFARFLYYPRKGQKEFMFTYIILSSVLAILCIMVKRVELSFGLALGIFAIFSLLRYRTISISIREMTYLFLCSGIAAKNSLAPDDMEFFRLLISDGVLLILAGLGEYFLFRDTYVSKTILYNKPAYAHPDRKQELLNDLSMQFGIRDVKDLKIGRIDTLKGSVRLKVIFKDTNNMNLADD